MESDSEDYVALWGTQPSACEGLKEQNQISAWGMGSELCILICYNIATFKIKFINLFSIKFGYYF